MPIPGRDSNPVRADSCSFRTKAHIQAGADWASTGTCSRRDIGKDRRGQRKSQGTPGSSNCSPRTFLGQAVVDQATRVEATRREKCFEKAAGVVWQQASQAVVQGSGAMLTVNFVPTRHGALRVKTEGFRHLS